MAHRTKTPAGPLSGSCSRPDNGGSVSLTGSIVYLADGFRIAIYTGEGWVAAAAYAYAYVYA